MKQLRCKFLGHKFWKREQTSTWSYSKVPYEFCVRSGCNAPKPPRLERPYRDDFDGYNEIGAMG